MKKTRWVILILLALLLVTTAAWATPAQAAPEAKKAKCGECVYRVKKGDTLYSIGQRYDVSVKVLKRCNSIKNVNRIQVGQKLWVPCKAKVEPRPPKKPAVKPHVQPPKWSPRGCRGVYLVKPGDTLSSIARRTCSTVNAIAQRNGIWNPNRIHSWTRLCIPQWPNKCRW